MIHTIKGDITKITNVQAVVNAANKTLLGGGGVDGAIHRAAGRELLEECRTLHGCETGEAKITKAYKLPCDYVIHTVGPVWSGGKRNEPELLSSCYRNSLQVAVDHGIRTIAFPSISTGVYHFPVEEAASIALNTVSTFLEEHPNQIDEVYWVLFDDKTLEVYKKELERITDVEHIMVEDAEVQSGINDANKPFNILNKAKNAVLNTVDQNNDGKLDLKDIKTAVRNVGDAAQKTTNRLKESAKQGSEQLGGWLAYNRDKQDMKALNPVFKEEMNQKSFQIPKLVRIANMDKQHADSEICKGSIGFRSNLQDTELLTIYPSAVKLFELSFYPDNGNAVYYVDPVHKERYIALDEYFEYLKKARVRELQKVAQQLGAKHFRVTFMEEKRTSSEHQADFKINKLKVGKLAAGLKLNQRKEENGLEMLEISAEMEFEGHDPVVPQLQYCKNDIDILGLIDMRMKDNKLKHQKVTINCRSLLGMNQQEAAEVDAALAMINCSSRVKVEQRASQDARRSFEYEIDF